MLFKSLVRPVLFRLSTGDPEKAHHWVMKQLAFASHYRVLLKIVEVASAYKTSTLERDVFGIHFNVQSFRTSAGLFSFRPERTRMYSSLLGEKVGEAHFFTQQRRILCYRR